MLHYKYNYCISTQLLALAQLTEKVLHNSYNMGTHNLPDMHALSPQPSVCPQPSKFLTYVYN